MADETEDFDLEEEELSAGGEDEEDYDDEFETEEDEEGEETSQGTIITQITDASIAMANTRH